MIVTRVTRSVVTAAAALLLLAACDAATGIDGGPADPAAAPAPAPAPAPPAGPVLIGTGLIADPVALRTPGPATFSVRTVVVPPGVSTGWHVHPGTETSVVTAGEITLLREDACEPQVLRAGDAVFIPDAQPHLARNDGTEPAEVVVTYLVAPGEPERGDVRPACP